MIQSFHGGACCGMTHIFSFPATPDVELAATKFLTEAELRTRNSTSPALSRYRNNAFPAQTALDRLKEMIRGIEEGTPQDEANIYAYQAARPKGCIEVVLTEGQCLNWEKTLLDLDFKIVNTFVNSNSSRKIKVFHRNSGAKGVRFISTLSSEAQPVSIVSATPAPSV